VRAAWQQIDAGARAFSFSIRPPWGKDFAADLRNLIMDAAKNSNTFPLRRFLLACGAKQEPEMRKAAAVSCTGYMPFMSS